jgi:hypothetical protein
MRCRRVICAACCTKLDGINHCHACLKALGQRDQSVSTGTAAWGLTAVGVLGLCGLGLAAVGWLIQGRLAP